MNSVTRVNISFFIVVCFILLSCLWGLRHSTPRLHVTKVGLFIACKKGFSLKGHGNFPNIRQGFVRESRGRSGRKQGLAQDDTLHRRAKTALFTGNMPAVSSPPTLGEAGGELLLIVNLIHIRFAFACNFLYICIGESLKRLSPFLLCGVEKEAVWQEQAFNMADMMLQYALFCSVKWLTLRDKMSDFSL